MRTETVETPHDLFRAHDAALQLDRQEVGQIRVVDRQAVAQKVQLTPPGFDAELTSGDHAHADGRAGGNRLGEAGDRVMVGEGNRRHTGIGGASHNLFGRRLAV